MLSQDLDLVGKKFGRLLVIKRAENNKFGQTRWLCKCDCGNEKIIARNDLVSGKTQSCGCFHREQCKLLNSKHTFVGTKIYYVWEDMKRRCLKSNHHAYKHYGGRGIEVFKDWQENFVNFKDWAMANGYKEGLTLDRIDVNGNYCPENCRWVDFPTQTRNKRTNVNLTYKGKTMCVTDWAKEVGLKPLTLAYRIRVGWDVEKALTYKVNNG